MTVNTTTDAAPRPATLLDLLKALAARPWLLLACAAAGAALGLLAASGLPASYEGSVLVRVGLLPHGISMLDAREPRDAYEALAMRMVEPPVLAAERIRTPGFVAAAGLPGSLDEQLAAIYVRVVRETDLLELRYRAHSPQAVEQGLRALLETLRKRHEELAQAGRERARQELQVLEQLRQEAASRRREILQASGTRVDPQVLLMATTASDDGVRWEAGLRAALQPQFTRATAAVEPIAVSPRRRDPATFLRVAGGALLGALAAAAVILFRYSARRRASR